MKYIVIGETVVLSSRSVERISDNSENRVSVVNVPDGATLSIINHGTVRSYNITSETTHVDFKEYAKGRCDVSVTWETYEDGKTISHEAYGNPFTISNDSNGMYIIPTPLSGSTEIERIWQSISNILEVLIPLEDDVKNGSHVV